MKRLTSISIILMIPTLVSSFYGMNVPNGLESNPFGFIIIFFFSVLVATIGVFMFKRNNFF
jgi:magnesium transporter